MDIGALSMVLSQINVRQEANVSLIKKTLDQAETNSDNVVKMLERSVQPHLGESMDLRG